MTFDPATAVMTRVKTVADATYDAEGWEVTWDRLLRATGQDVAVDQAILGIYPEVEQPNPARHIELRTPVVVQFHLGFQAEPDETIQRDPRVVTGYAARLREAFAPDLPGDDDVWFLNFGEITYPPDPTGNITRFEARIVGVGRNPAAGPS